MKFIKILTLSLGLVVLSMLAFVGVASAQSFKTGDSIAVPANETVNSMLFAGGNNIDIAGIVNGDVYCGGQTITISGTVNGDVICVGQTIVVSGKVDGNVRLGGQTVTISNTIGGSATIGAQTLVIDKNAKITNDLLGGSQNVTVNGEIMRDVVAGASNLTINGKVGRNIKGGAENLTIGSSGLVGGNVDYASDLDPYIAKGGKIVGTVTRTIPQQKSSSVKYAPVMFSVGIFIYGFIAMMIVALVFAGLFPRILNEAVEETKKKPWITLLVGFLASILIPVSIGLLFISFIGIPLAILVLLTWFVTMIISGPFVGYIIGKFLLPKSKQPVGIMALGAAALIVTYFIPIIGFFTMLAAYLFGMGMVLNRGKWLLLRAKTKKV